MIGLSDKDVSEMLHLRAELTLETACETARKCELVKSQMNNMSVGKSHKNVEAIHLGKTYRNCLGSTRGAQHGGSTRGSHLQYRGSIQRGKYYSGNRNPSQELCNSVILSIPMMSNVLRKGDNVGVVILTWIILRHVVVRVYRNWYMKSEMTIHFS